MKWKHKDRFRHFVFLNPSLGQHTFFFSPQCFFHIYLEQDKYIYASNNINSTSLFCLRSEVLCCYVGGKTDKFLLLEMSSSVEKCHTNQIIFDSSLKHSHHTKWFACKNSFFTLVLLWTILYTKDQNSRSPLIQEPIYLCICCTIIF